MTVCMCGHKIKAGTLDELWAAFDDHCEDRHGRVWPRNVLKKGEQSMTRHAQYSRRSRAKKQRG